MSVSPRKVFRVSAYYAKLIRYAATARPKIFHILWNNKLEDGIQSIHASIGLRCESNIGLPTMSSFIRKR